MSSTHSRHNSDSYDSSGASYPLILEHILTYPGTYELPLRTMYTLNSTPRAQPPRSRPQTPNPDVCPSPTQPHFPNDAKATATAEFQSSLVNQISNLPSQPCSLPPVFITTFVRRCFADELVKVDFPQALTALDYLKDLENRRRREVAAALGRLGLDRTTVSADMEGVARKNASVAAWVKQLESNERKVEALYTQVYIGLRRWILINELSLTPFDKHNCIAMLNTLYPPVTSLNTPQPTSILTPAVLKTQRAGFFDWVRHVEQRGSTTLEPLMQQGKRANTPDVNGWPAVHDCLDSYLRVAMHIIDECRSIQGFEDFNAKGRKTSSSSDKERDRRDSRVGRKADSGVSFSSSRQDHMQTPRSDHGPQPTSKRRPSTSDSDSKTIPSSPAPTSFPRNTSTLEKLARELRKLKSTRGPQSPNSVPPTPRAPDYPGPENSRSPENPDTAPHSRQTSNSGSVHSSGSNKENHSSHQQHNSTNTRGRNYSLGSTSRRFNNPFKLTAPLPSQQSSNQEDQEPPPRPSSRAGRGTNAVLRSIGRVRERSRSRSRHRAESNPAKLPAMRDDDIPPVPRSEFEDDEEEAPARGTRFGRSASVSRGGGVAGQQQAVGVGSATSKALKKMRSLGDVGGAKLAGGVGVKSANAGMSVTADGLGRRSTDAGLVAVPDEGGDDVAFFDKEEMRRQRGLWEEKERQRQRARELWGGTGIIRETSIGKAV